MAPDVNEPAAPDFRDRKTGLVVFGILEIVLGGFCALAVPFMLLGALASAALDRGSAPPANVRMLVPGLLLYAVAAVWFIWMGIGSIKAQRWARALLLVSSWIWLISGVVGLAAMLAFLPAMSEQMSRNAQTPQGLVGVMMGIMIGFMTCFYVIVPGAMVLFYGSRHVKATCERRNPQTCWTDKCPLPVLAASFLFSLGAVSLLLTPFCGFMVPFFGTILSGWAGGAAGLVLSALTACIAWGSYRLDRRAWWCAVLLTVVGTASAAVTFSRVSLMDIYERTYERMNLPAEQLERMRPVISAMSSWMVPLMMLSAILCLGYLLYIRRYFARPPERPAA